MKYPTAHQRLLRAYERQRGVRLSAREVFDLVAMDTAIKDAAENDDFDEKAERARQDQKQ